VSGNSVYSPCFTSIYEGGDNDGFVDCTLCFDGKFLVVSNLVFESANTFEALEVRISSSASSLLLLLIVDPRYLNVETLVSS